MDVLKTIWQYTDGLWGYATPFLILFLGTWIGIRIGKKQGIKLGKNAMLMLIKRNLGILDNFYAEASHRAITMDGRLILEPADSIEQTAGLPFGFKFTPNAKWVSRPC